MTGSLWENDAEKEKRREVMQVITRHVNSVNRFRIHYQTCHMTVGKNRMRQFVTQLTLLNQKSLHRSSDIFSLCDKKAFVFLHRDVKHV